jgi:hypothetical protein
MADRRPRLANRFRKQAEFARDYSPVYERLWATVAGWLDGPAAGDDPVAAWLVAAAGERDTLDVTLLLAAGLHRDALAGRPEAADLAAYFPSTGGTRPADAPGFDAALRAAILARRESLAALIHSGLIQTNETGRGLCWLMPALAMASPAIHLVELAASAGLNLAAEQRAYRLVDERSGRVLLDAGLGEPVQFVTQCTGDLDPLAALAGRRPPRILSRTGCDLNPLGLRTREDELRLMALTWPDQLARLQRLEEGIAGLRRCRASAAPVTLHQARLPEELDDFLATRVPARPNAPVVLYNTVMRNYLPDRGASLGERIGRWAATRSAPVLWLQWELPDNLDEVPAYGWCPWTADLWRDGRHEQWLLGQAHAHGTAAAFGAGLAAWIEAVGQL